MKKKGFFALFILFFSAFCFCQEIKNDSTEADSSIQKNEVEENKILKAINDSPYPEQIIEERTKHGIDWFVNIEPLFTFRTGNYVSPNSANPASVMAIFPFSIGIIFPEETRWNFQPKFTIFSVYYCWDGENAYPATQIESIATAFNFLIDLPLAFNYCVNERHWISASTGAAFLFRTACPINGLQSSLPSHDSTVGEELHKINTWFWLNGNFLYWDFAVSYLYQVKKSFKIGPEFRFYLPLGSLFQGKGINGFMLGFGLKANF